MTVGWSRSPLDVLPETTSSGTDVLDKRRIPGQTAAAQMATGQLDEVVLHLALLAADCCLGSARFVRATGAVACDKMRVKMQTFRKKRSTAGRNSHV
jgi:hypothetical protein